MFGLLIDSERSDGFSGGARRYGITAAMARAYPGRAMGRYGITAAAKRDFGDSATDAARSAMVTLGLISPSASQAVFVTALTGWARANGFTPERYGTRWDDEAIGALVRLAAVKTAKAYAPKRLRGYGITAAMARAYPGDSALHGFAEDTPTSGQWESAIGPVYDPGAAGNKMSPSWVDIATSVANTVAGVLRPNTDPNDPRSYACPPGYQYDMTRATCRQVSSGPGIGTMVAIGALGVGALLLLKK